MNSVELNSFSVEVVPSFGYSNKTIIDGANYYKLPHKSEYKIRLSNNNYCRCDATVWLEGEQIGTWRLNCHQTITIARPANIDRKFTFVRDTSLDALRAGVQPNKEDNGLIKVVFKPERNNYYTLEDTWDSRDSGIRRCCNQSITESQSYAFSNNVSSGSTILGDRSGQQFTTASQLFDIDQENITTIYIRLLVDDSMYKNKYISVKDSIRF